MELIARTRAGDGGLAEFGRFPGAFVDADLAVPGGHEPLSKARCDRQGGAPRMDLPPPERDPPEPTRLAEVVWLDPYPDVLLEGLADSAPGPQARYEAREAISLAFVTAVQLLPPARVPS